MPETGAGQDGPTLEAPLYPPSEAFERPVVVPHGLSTTTSSIAALLADARAKAIVTREIPGFEQRVSSAQLQPHIDNLSPRALVQFGVFKPADLDRADAQLRALPPASGGGQ